MLAAREILLKQAYKAFNTRDIEDALKLMHSEVVWPNGWEGGYVMGHDEVRAYWKRQWEELNPIVEPVSFKFSKAGNVEVSVHQIVKNYTGTLIFDGIVTHIYSFENDLIKRMEIKLSDT